jgi:hypothetical protein
MSEPETGSVAHTRQSRLNAGFGFQVRVFESDSRWSLFARKRGFSFLGV